MQKEKKKEKSDVRVIVSEGPSKAAGRQFGQRKRKTVISQPSELIRKARGLPAGSKAGNVKKSSGRQKTRTNQEKKNQRTNISLLGTRGTRERQRHCKRRGVAAPYGQKTKK